MHDHVDSGPPPLSGALGSLPLLEILNLIHETGQSGALEVDGAVPFAVTFSRGEVVGGGILDWQGTEALHAAPLLVPTGVFEFLPREAVGAPPLPPAPFSSFLSEWARVSDEWTQVCRVIGSPSRAFRGPEGSPWGGGRGRSAREVAEATGRPLAAVCRDLAAAAEANEVGPTGAFAWDALVLPRGGYRRPAPGLWGLNGAKPLREVIEGGVGGVQVWQVRAWLLNELRAGLRFPGAGWVLRDLVWEQEHWR